MTRGCAWLCACVSVCVCTVAEVDKEKRRKKSEEVQERARERQCKFHESWSCWKEKLNVASQLGNQVQLFEQVEYATKIIRNIYKYIYRFKIGIAINYVKFVYIFNSYAKIETLSRWFLFSIFLPCRSNKYARKLVGSGAINSCRAAFKRVETTLSKENILLSLNKSKAFWTGVL